MDWIAIASGVAIGGIVGMTGVGGGSLVMPRLLSVFKLNPAAAIGTDLWFAAITKTAGSVSHHRAGHVDWKLSGLLLAGSIPAVLATVGLVRYTGITTSWAGALTFTLCIALLLTAVTVAYKRAWQRAALWPEHWIPERRKHWFTIGCALILGALVSLSSVVAGAVDATRTLPLYPRPTLHEIVGNDIAHAVPLTLAAGIGHATLRYFDWSLLGALLVGFIPGLWISAQLTRKMPGKLVPTLLCVAPVSAGLKVIT